MLSLYATIFIIYSLYINKINNIYTHTHIYIYIRTAVSVWYNNIMITIDTIQINYNQLLI